MADHAATHASTPSSIPAVQVAKEGFKQAVEEGVVAYGIHLLGDRAFKLVTELFTNAAESRKEEARKAPERQTRFSNAMTKLYAEDETAWKIINHLQVILKKPKHQADFQIRCAKGRTEEELVAYLKALARGFDDVSERIEAIKAEGYVGKRAVDPIEKTAAILKDAYKTGCKSFKKFNNALAGTRKSREKNKNKAKDAKLRLHKALNS